MLTSTVFAVQKEVEKIEAGFQIKPDIGLNTDCNCNNVDIPSPPIYQEVILRKGARIKGARKKGDMKKGARKKGDCKKGARKKGDRKKGAK